MKPIVNAAEPKRFWRIATAGIFFQAGAAAIDTSTIVATLVHGLSGSAVAVGAAAAIARAGWLVPQLFVGYVAQRHTRRMPFYMVGAFGRAACLGGLAGLLWLATRLPHEAVIGLFFALWTLYAFIGGVVAVPYNDIVARAIPSSRRSRMLAIRFFGGSLLALGVAAAAHRLLDTLPFHRGYGTVLLLGAALLFASALFFVSAGEPTASSAPSAVLGFSKFLRDGIETLRHDRRFRLFVVAQWLGSAAALAIPFYVLLTMSSAPEVAFLLAAQTAGALLSNPLWGWWGDRLSKLSLLGAVAALGAVPPLLALTWIAAGARGAEVALPWFVVVFFLLGAAGNGGTIAQLGYLMEISPDDRRPAYSGYFNALVAPATLLPLVGAALAEATSYAAVFAASAAAALLQIVATRRLRAVLTGDDQ